MESLAQIVVMGMDDVIHLDLSANVSMVLLEQIVHYSCVPLGMLGLIMPLHLM
jgi:hypothetical protein